MTRPLVKYHGGKGRIFKWIVPLIPNHKIYCEPFGGAASVLLNKEISELEIYNDLEPRIVNLLRVVRDNVSEFMNCLKDVEYTREVYESYRGLYFSDQFIDLDPLEQAKITYIVKRMSRGGLCGTFSWSSRIYSTGPAEVHCWNSGIENILDVHERMKEVQILHTDALELIQSTDSYDTAFYLDPPYLHSTRKSKNIYDHEMSIEDHKRMLEICLTAKAKIVISGYPSEIYSDTLSGWRTIMRKTANHSSHGKKKERMEETLWLNF